MAQKLKFGNGTWATKKGSTLSYNDENNNFKPLPFTTTRNSIATRVNKQGLIEVVGNDVPRIDYTDSAEGALLLEPSRSNILPYSEDYSQSVYTKRNCSISQNNAISPSGKNDATLVTATGSDAAIFDNIGVTNGTKYTLSVYLKSVSGNVNTSISLGSAGFPNGEGDDGKYKNIVVTNEWQRFTITSTANASAGTDIAIIGGFGGFDSGEEVLVWGAQLEAGSYASSYIPTSGSSITRQADTASGSGNSEVFNDSEGVLFLNLNTSDTSAVPVISLSDNTFNNEIEFAYYGTNQWNFILRVSGGDSVVIGTVNASDFSKFSVSYTTTDFKVYLNGFLIGSNTLPSSLSGLKVLDFNLPDNNNPFYGKAKEIGYYDTALTDEELETLTSYRSLNELVTELNLNTL